MWIEFVWLFFTGIFALIMMSLVDGIIILEECYCSKCGQYLGFIPYKNRVLQILFKGNSICTNLQCSSLQLSPLHVKAVNASMILSLCWGLFYGLLFRLNWIEEMTISVIYMDILTVFLMSLALFVVWYVTRTRKSQLQKLIHEMV